MPVQHRAIRLRLAQRLHKSQYFGGVARNFNATPFLDQFAFGINDKGAALDATYLFPIHIFLPVRPVRNVTPALRALPEGKT